MKVQTRSVTLSDFSALDIPHPYGVLPGGNRFFGQQTSVRSEEIFRDELWQQILEFCDGATLARVVQTSRYLYVAGHQPELWRDLVLRNVDREGMVISHVGSSWKDTYVYLYQTNTTTSNRSLVNHRPMCIPGIYSDDYYRTHLCRSFAIPDAWLEPTTGEHKNEIPRVSVDKLTPEEFFTKFERPNLPVIIGGAAKSPALEKWQDPNYLLVHGASSTSFRATSGAAPLPANFTLKAYQEYCRFSYLEESPLYLFDRTAFQIEQWKDDFFPEFHRRCPYWDPLGEYGHDLLQHLGEERRPDHTWLITGPKRSGSVFHIDPNATHAWNACIAGRKHWIFYPPGVAPPGVYPSSDGDEVALPLSVGEWLIQYWKEHLEQCRKRPLNDRPLECTVEPGDVLFVPHGWWHMVVNLDDTNIAITHNYVSRSNLGNVLKFFTQKEDQISGCRDRAETVKPEHLYDEFVKVLSEKEPHALSDALAQSNWTCHAWSNPDLTTSNKENSKPKATSFISRKRTHCQDDSKDCNERTSVMARTEKLSSFSFSFM